MPIAQTSSKQLHEYIEANSITDPEAYLFPSAARTPYDPKNYLNRKLKPLVKEAKISKVNFQVLRRICATHFQDYGKVKDTQALLWHTNPSVTLKHYQKKLDKNLVAAVANLAPSIGR